MSTPTKALKVDLADWSYVQCRTYMIGQLETCHLIGLDADDETWKFVKKMEADGWSLEVAEKCRRSAGAMANRRSGAQAYLPRQGIVVDMPSKRATRRVKRQQAVEVDLTEAEKLFG